MSKPAARIADPHVCPMVTPGTPPVPHVGGPVMGPGVATVLIGGAPAAVAGDSCTCVGPPDTIIVGSSGVLIGGKPAARMGDTTAHGGTIAAGCPTVLIGEVGNVTVKPSPVETAKAATEAVPAEKTEAKSKAAVVNSQKATMIQAAETGAPFAHNPESCRKCKDGKKH